MSKIKKIHARTILDSRGIPTVEAEITTEKFSARASVPSGASTGTREAVELRDQAKPFGGRGVARTVQNVNEILAPPLIGCEVTAQPALDATLCDLDGTTNKRKLGANALLAVSLAAVKVAAQEKQLPLFKYFGELAQNQTFTLPIPLLNILNGGKHADNGLALQEFLLVPTGFTNFPAALRAGVETYYQLKGILQKAGQTTNVGDEGGFAPNFQTTSEALAALQKAILQAGYTGKIKLALDAAASEFYHSGYYELDGKRLTSLELIDFYQKLSETYPLVSLEDGLAENDFNGWKILTEKLGKKIQLVGDDLFCTNPAILQEGIKNNSANAILIKPNQIGTVSETLETITCARKAHYATIISHRSGETEDTTIADLAVGVAAGQIKTGAPTRTDRTAKYNQLLRIAERLDQASLAPFNFK